MPKKNQALSEKHWKALQLIDEGKSSLKEIAKICDWSAAYMYDLYEGDTEKGGKIAELFQAEVRKLENKNVSRIKTLTKDNKQLALRMMNEFLRRKMSMEYVSDDDTKLITTVFNALSKATPNVEIGSMSWSYVKGLTTEELVHEFNKLKSLAEGSSDSRGVSKAGSGSSRVLPSSAERRSEPYEEPEDPDL